MAALVAAPDASILTPEYIAYTNAPELLTQFGSLFAVTSVVVLLRFYVRACMIKSFGKDDWLMLLAYAFAAATFGVYVEQINLGMGKHMAVITMDRQKYSQFLRLRQVASILASFGVALVKMSIAYFLLRLVVHRGYVWFLHGLNIFMALITLACVGTLASELIPHTPSTSITNGRLVPYPPSYLTTPMSPLGLTPLTTYMQIWQCVPVEATWKMELRPPPIGTGTAKCFSPETFTAIGLMNTIVTIVTDFMVALLPIPLIWQLQLNLRSKISLMFVLSLGVFAAVAAIVKSQVQKTFFQDPEPFIEDRFTLWRFIEFDVGIIAASLPALKPLLNWLLGAARSLTAQRESGRPNSLGYQKQSERSNRAIVLNEYTAQPSNSVRISSTRPGNRRLWCDGPGKTSDESILPLHSMEEKSGAIVVTRDVHVN